MRKKIILSITLMVFLIFALVSPSFADFGDYERYDSGSSSSWSSSSSDYSDWGSSSSDWGSSYSSSGSSGDLGFIFGLLLGNSAGRVVLIILIIFIIAVIRRSRKTNQMDRPYQTGNMDNNVTDVSQTHIYADALRKIDPNFSEEKMLSYAKDLFIKLQHSWMDRDLEPIRPFVSETLFEQHNSQVKRYIETNRINVLDRIAVNYATIYKFWQEGDRDILEVAVKSTMKDYIIDEKTKEVLEGNKTQDKINVYVMTFERKTGVLTQEGEEEIKTTNCPNCGAPTKITSAGKCEYCGSIIKTGANTWTLSRIERLRK